MKKNLLTRKEDPTVKLTHITDTNEKMIDTVLYSMYQWGKEHAVHALITHIAHPSLMFNRNYSKCKLFYKIKLIKLKHSKLAHRKMNSSIFKKIQKWLGKHKTGIKGLFWLRSLNQGFDTREKWMYLWFTKLNLKLTLQIKPDSWIPDERTTLTFICYSFSPPLLLTRETFQH